MASHDLFDLDVATTFMVSPTRSRLSISTGRYSIGLVDKSQGRIGCRPSITKPSAGGCQSIWSNNSATGRSYCVSDSRALAIVNWP